MALKRDTETSWVFKLGISYHVEGYWIFRLQVVVLVTGQRPTRAGFGTVDKLMFQNLL